MKHAKLFFTALALVLLTALLTTGILAEEPHGGIVDSGECGETMTWTLYKDGLFELSGEGEMQDWNDYSASVHSSLNADGTVSEFSLTPDPTPWKDYKDQIRTVTMDDGITSVGRKAFSCCYQLESVRFPKELKKIDSYAFAGCLSLSGALDLPDGLEWIDTEAFLYCQSVESVRLPDTLEKIHFEAFKGTGIKSVFLPDTLSLDQFGFGNGFITEFLDCRNFTEYRVSAENPYFTVIDGILYSKDGSILVSCPTAREIEDLSLPSSVTEIKSYAFYQCRALRGSLNLPSRLSVIGQRAFYGCKLLTGDLVIPDRIEKIESSAFENCSGFTGDLTIGDGVNEICFDAFDGCSGFTGTLSFGRNVETIGSSAFRNCGGFSGTLRVSEKLIRGILTSKEENPDYWTNPLSDLTGISAYELSEDSAQYMVWDGILCTADGTTMLMCPAGKSGSLAFHPACTAIEASACRNCALLTGPLTLPEDLTSIGKDAFYGCNGFTGSLTIPVGVTSIGANAFRECRGFDGCLLIPDGVMSIGDYAFYGCNKITLAYFMGDAPQDFGNGVFPKPFYAPVPFAVYYLSGKTGFETPEWMGCPCHPVDAIDPTVIYRGECGDHLIWLLHDDGLLEISGTGPMWDYETEFLKFGTVRSTAPWAQSGKPLTALKLHEGMTTIGKSAFIQCNDFRGDLVIPDSVTTIGEDAFGLRFTDNTSFDGRLILGKNVTTIGDFAFAYCTSFTESLILPESVRTIGKQAFMECNGFTGDLTIPDGVVSIGERAFAFRSISDSSFTGRLTVSGTVTEIGAKAFENCGVTSALFLGDAPETVDGLFGKRGDDFVIRYLAGTSGWTNPWKGYKTAVWIEGEIALLSQSAYRIETDEADGSRFVTNVPEKTDLKAFLSNFDGESLVLCDAAGRALDQDSPVYVGTGFKLKALDADGNPTDEVTVVVRGDLTGDGLMNASDRMALSRTLADPAGFADPLASRAADLNGDNSVTSADRLILARTLAGWPGRA